MSSVQGYYDILLRACAKYPSKIAMRCYEDGTYTHYTYSELYGVCEYIYQNLQQLQCNKGIIGFLTEKNVIIPCLIAAAHKCSSTFMFIDPSQDIKSVTNDIAFTIIIRIRKKQPIHSFEPLKLLGKEPDKNITIFNLVVSFYSCYTDKTDTTVSNTFSFIARTSGSTGKPKNIQVPIQCIQPNIDDLTKFFNIIPEDIIYFSTPLTFDPSMVEILLACVNGASLLIAPEKADILFPENKNNSITIWQTTPSKFFQFSDADIKNKILDANSTLKVLALGGEPLNGVRRLRELKDKDNKTRIFTLYGVTEMSCWACIAEVDLDKEVVDREVPLGSCLSETEFIVEPAKNDSNLGKMLLISKTRTCYILNNSHTKGKEQKTLNIVDTGDLGEMKNSTVYYRGRTDDIIKRFGHKVNLQSIEAIIMQHLFIRACSCVWLPEPMLLIVYFSSESVSCQELSNYLRCRLDDKHWPDKILKVDNLPINFHGKLSKQLILKTFNMETEKLTEESLKRNFMKELKMALNKSYTYNQIRNKDFFSIGGTSFLAVSMCNKLSIFCPQIGMLIQPYLLSPKYTIDDIMDIVRNEMNFENVKPKRQMKRPGTGQTSVVESSSSHKKCVMLVDFALVWTFDTAKCVDASPTLFQTDSKLYVTVGSHSGNVVVIDARSGVPQGILAVNSRVEAPVLCFQQAEMSPCGVVGAYDGTVVCFTLDECRELWRTNIRVMVKSKMVICNGKLYVAGYDGRLRCLDVKTGEIIDTIPVSEQAISADLVVAKEQYIVLGSLCGDCVCVHAGSSAVCWRDTLKSPVFAAPALYGDDKYVVFADVGGEIHCRTVEKGIKIWEYRDIKGNIFSSIYVKQLNNFQWRLVFGCFDNNVYSLTVKNCEVSLHWTTKMSSAVYSTPCGLDDRTLLAVSNDGTLSVVDADTGTKMAEYRLPKEAFSSPASYGNHIFIGCRDDNLYALKLTFRLRNSP